MQRSVFKQKHDKDDVSYNIFTFIASPSDISNSTGNIKLFRNDIKYYGIE